MNRRGFTLIEIIMVMALIGILLSMASLQFSDYIRKGAIERQTQELYSDLMATRTAAVTQRSSKRVLVTPIAFTFISSALGSGVGRTTRVLSRPVIALKSTGVTETQLTFDERGTFNIDVNDENTAICVEPSLESAQYDSIVVYSTRIHLGKVTFGGACNSANFTVK